MHHAVMSIGVVYSQLWQYIPHIQKWAKQGPPYKWNCWMLHGVLISTSITSTIFIHSVQVHYLSIFCLLHFLALRQMQTAIGTQAPPTNRNTTTTTATMVALLVDAIALGGISAWIGFKVQMHAHSIYNIARCLYIQSLNALPMAHIPVPMFSTSTINWLELDIQL